MSIIQKQQTNLTLQLRPHSFHHLKDARPGMLVVCEKGNLHMTQSGDLQDYALRTGEQAVLAGKGTVLIEAQSEAHVCILYPN